VRPGWALRHATALSLAERHLRGQGVQLRFPEGPDSCQAPTPRWPPVTAAWMRRGPGVPAGDGAHRSSMPVPPAVRGSSGCPGAGQRRLLQSVTEPATGRRFLLPHGAPAPPAGAVVFPAAVNADTTPPLSLPLPRASQQVAWVAAPPGAALALALTGTARQAQAPVLAITADSPAAHALEADLADFAGDLPVMPFPDWEILPYDLFAPHPDIVSRRIAAMNALPRLRQGIVVVPVSTLIQRLPPRSYVHGRTLLVKVGDRLDLAAEQQRLAHAGYRHVPQVTEPGEFAVRGALLDIFAMGQAEPVRIELFDRSEEHTSELQSRENLVCRLLLEKKNGNKEIKMKNNRIMK